MAHYLMTLNDDSSSGWTPCADLLPIQTKGDLLTRTATAPYALAVGANGTHLEADSTQDCGVKWSDIHLPTSAPASPIAGSIYFDTTLNILYIYNGTVWKQMAFIL